MTDRAEGRSMPGRGREKERIHLQRKWRWMEWQVVEPETHKFIVMSQKSLMVEHLKGEGILEGTGRQMAGTTDMVRDSKMRRVWRQLTGKDFLSHS